MTKKGRLKSLIPRDKLSPRPFCWQVGYRQIEGRGVADRHGLDGAPFTVLPDDGKRFYADPFVIAQDGRRFLFVEEYPYATGKGVLSVAEFQPDGRFGVPRVVLEEPHHLSYPQVFSHAGDVYMVPESSAALEVVLYRAIGFPDRWVRDTVLLADRHIGDPTLMERDGRFWLIGTEQRHGGNCHSVAVFFADRLRGPYRPHRLNPIVIDRAAARPGGAVVVRDGRAFLPVQDGSRIYGGGLGLAELVQLDEDDVRFAPPLPSGRMTRDAASTRSTASGGWRWSIGSSSPRRHSPCPSIGSRFSCHGRDRRLTHRPIVEEDPPHVFDPSGAQGGRHPASAARHFPADQPAARAALCPRRRRGDRL